jgi:hypothetical protein
VAGTGFPAFIPVYLYLGLPNSPPVAEPLAAGIADSSGQVSISFIMPGLWPDGTVITESQLVIVAIGGNVQAQAPFTYVP